MTTKKYIAKRSGKNQFAVYLITKLNGTVLSEKLMIDGFKTLKSAVEEVEVLNDELEQEKVRRMKMRYAEIQWLNFMEAN